MPSQKPPMKRSPDQGASRASGSPIARARAVDPAALGVLVGVGHLVGGDPERSDAPLARDHVRQPQGVLRAVVVVAQETGRRLEADAAQPVGVEQRPRQLRSRHACAVWDAAIPRED
jgi:hypothetical protein